MSCLGLYLCLLFMIVCHAVFVVSRGHQMSARWSRRSAESMFRCWDMWRLHGPVQVRASRSGT